MLTHTHRILTLRLNRELHLLLYSCDFSIILKLILASIFNYKRIEYQVLYESFMLFANICYALHIYFIIIDLCTSVFKFASMALLLLHIVFSTNATMLKKGSRKFLFSRALTKFDRAIICIFKWFSRVFFTYFYIDIRHVSKYSQKS